MTYEATRRVETSVRTFTIVEHLMGAGPSRVSAIAADLEMTKGIVHNHLSTLRELGYVCKVDERYQLSPKFLSVGHRVRTASPLYRAAHDPLDSFAARLDSDVVLYSQTGRDAVVIDTHGSGGLSDTVVGTTHPLSDCLAGLTIQLTADESEHSAETVYDLDRLADQLDDDGFVVDRLSSSTPQLACGVPITTEPGDCLGSVVVLVASDETPRDELGRSILSVREQIERRVAGEPTERSFATEKHAWIDR